MRPHMLDCNVPVRRKQNRRLVSTQPLAFRIWGMVVIKTCRAKSGRIIAPMTQARTASHGVVTPPPLQHWLHAVLMLFAELVQGVATTLGMWRGIGRRDWHTQSGSPTLPQATSDIQLRNDTTVVAAAHANVPPPSFDGLRMSRGRRSAHNARNIGIQVGDRPHPTHRQDKATHRPPPDLRQLRASRPQRLPRLILSPSKDGGGIPQRAPNQRQRTSTHTNPAAPRQGSRPRAYSAATAHFRSTIGSPTSFAGGWFIGRDGAAPGR
jgi:hypothetical protein